MRLVSWDALLSGAERIESPVSLTIGVFDGLHAGHRRLIEAVRQDADRFRKERAVPLVITFRQNPDSVFPGRAFDGDLQTFRLKLEGLDSLGIATVLAIDFSPELGKLSGKAFTAILRSNLDVRGVVIGYDFHLGNGRDTDEAALRVLWGGTEVRVSAVEPVLHEGGTVSSSRIRSAVREGRFRDAEAMLMGGYVLDLRGLAPESWNGGGCLIPLARCRQVLPPAGTYDVTFLGGGCRMSGRLTIVGGNLVLETGGPGPFDSVLFSQPLKGVVQCH